MIPINAKQRQRAFLLFLGFFALTVGLALVAICLGMQAPFRENEVVKGQLARLQKNEAGLYSFAAKMNETEDLLDSVNRPGVLQPELIDRSISDRLALLNSMTDSDSSLARPIYKKIIAGLSNLKDAKKQLRQSGSDDAQIASLQRQVSDLENKLQQANLLLTMQSQSR